MDTGCDVLDKRLRIGVFETDLIPDRGRFGAIKKLFDKRSFALPCLRFKEEGGGPGIARWQQWLHNPLPAEKPRGIDLGRIKFIPFYL